jgi:hypothetical protein
VLATAFLLLLLKVALLDLAACWPYALLVRGLLDPPEPARCCCCCGSLGAMLGWATA